MITFELDISIHRPINQVFSFVTSPDNNKQWQYGILDSSSAPGVTSGLGTFFQSIGHFMGRRLTGTFEVTEFQANNKYGFRSISGPVRSKMLFTFEMAGVSTRILIRAEVESTGYFNTNEQTIAKKMKRQFKDNLEKLKEIMEMKQAIAGTVPL